MTAPGRDQICPFRLFLVMFSEMLWIGLLKRLSSGWPAAIKSSPNGCNDAAAGSLRRCLILQLVTVFSLLLSTASHLNKQRFCDSLRRIS